MDFFAEIDEQVATLRALLVDDGDVLTTAMRGLGDADVVAALRASAVLSRSAERITTLAAGLVADRSQRTAGHSGLAQSRGHRTAADLVQELTGSSRADAAQRIRAGAALLETDEHDSSASDDSAPLPDDEPQHDAPGQDQHASDDEPGTDAAADSEQQQDEPPRERPWHAPADDALLHGLISTAQHDAIVRGLGIPPLDGTANGAASPFRAAWRMAAEQLVEEASRRTLEELRSAARTLRDILDPEGAERRYLERHEARSYRFWTDQYGVHHGSFVYDDEGHALVRAVLDAALRPRRGGPRFVTAEEKQAAQALIDDPRSNDQLAYDLMIDLLHTGATADAATVFGVKQAGVRFVQTAGSDGAPGAAYTEDGLVALPLAATEQRICTTGLIPVTIDGCGNPLDVGRQQRLFTPKQRIALAIRDGGCRWQGCDRPASYCEAHHIDSWAEGGRTDLDRGILLCRFHHLQLHHGGWRITRDDDFVLHHREGETFDLPPRLALRYLFGDLGPPHRRFRRAA